MAGSIESPISADGLMTLPDGTNVYGDVYDEFYEDEAMTFNNNTTTPNQRAPTMDPPVSEQSLAMMTAREVPTPSTVPIAISFPSPTPTPEMSVTSAPSRPPTVHFNNTPRVNNATPQQDMESQRSIRSPDPPEEHAPSARSSTMISYATESVASPPPVEKRANATLSIASQSTISSPPPPTAPQQQTSQYASKSEVESLRRQLEQLTESTNYKINNLDKNINNVAKSIDTVKVELQSLGTTIGSTVMDAVRTAMALQQPSHHTHINTTSHQNTVEPPTDEPKQTTIESNKSTSEEQLQALIEKLDATQPSSKPLFTSFNQNNMDIMKWKSTCLLALAANKSAYYNSFVTTNENNERTD